MLGVYLGQGRQFLRQSVGFGDIESLTCFGFLQQLQCSLRVLAALRQVGNDLTLSSYALAPKGEVGIHLQEVLFKSLSVHAMTHAASARRRFPGPASLSPWSSRRLPKSPPRQRAQ